MKRLTLTAAAALLAFGLAGPAPAHEVKDPVCRMTVDSDTTKWKHRLGSKSFYFCSRQCVVRFAASPEKYEKLAAELEKGGAHDYVVDLKTSPNPVAGRPVELAFTVRYKESGKPVTEFEQIHERLFHLIMVTQDLRWFEHQHPVRGADGVFRKSWTFPVPGEYWLYADFTPADGDNQVIRLPLTIGGGAAKSVAPTPDRKRVKEAGRYRVELQVRGGPLRMERTAVLTYTIRDRRGRPVRDMQPFIGAMGHLLAISADGEQMVHTHAVYPTRPDGIEPGAIRITPAMATEKGPSFSFKLTLPTAGLYRVWTQYVHDNRVLTVPFTFDVEDVWGPAAAKAAPVKGGVQRATVVIDGEYHPGQVTVRAGRPVELTFVRKERHGCGDVIWLPGLGVKRSLKPGARTVVRFTPKRSGVIPFTCGMKMYEGRIAVR